LLGVDAKTIAPIDAQKVTINVAADGQPSQYELPAVPQAGETGEKSSYFEIVSEPLCKIVSGESGAKSTQARLSLDIGGKRYVGIIETAPHDHEHGHEGEHAHEGEHKDEHAEEHMEEAAIEPQAEPAEVAPAEPAEEPQAETAEQPKVEPAAESTDDSAEQPTTELTDEPAAEKPADEGAEK
jgi:hypothetical protein